MSEGVAPPPETFNFARHLLEANAGAPARSPSSTTPAR